MSQLATVLHRHRWGLALVGAAVIGILLVELAPGLVGEHESAVVKGIGVVLVVGLGCLVFLSLRDLMATPKHSDRHRG
jgi:hypothetical protein